jgi:hypothetical protein
MTSVNVGSEVYIPVWIVLDFLDTSPPDPFIKCKIVTIGERVLNSPTGTVVGQICDVELGKDGLIANAVPVEYLILPHELQNWATNIAKWFSDYPELIKQNEKH